MIEKIVARNGQPVCKFEGRLLSSSVDPTKEAKDWVDQQALLLKQNDKAVLLGLGSGYHFIELLKRYPKHRFLSIGFENHLLELIYEIHRALLQRIEFVILETPELTLASARIRNFLKSGPLILEHPSIRNLHFPFYLELRKRLIAREPLLFADWIRREPRLVQLFPLQAIRGGDEVQQMTVKDLNQLAVGRGGVAPKDVLIVRTLRELMK